MAMWLKQAMKVTFPFFLVSCADLDLEMDLTDGRLFHNQDTWLHRANEITAGNGEIEDSYFSPLLTFEPVEIRPGDPERDNLTVRIEFKDEETGQKQLLYVAAKGASVPFPATFGSRTLSDPHDHDPNVPAYRDPALRGGIMLGGPGLNVRGDAEGTVHMLVFVEGGKIKTALYSVPIRCGLSCETGPHFPVFRDPDTRSVGRGDLLDGDDCFIFSGLRMNVVLDRCEASPSRCESVVINSLAFDMLAGDIAIVDFQGASPSGLCG